MERTYPTGEFLKIQSEQYELFCKNNMIMVHRIWNNSKNTRRIVVQNERQDRKKKTLLLRNGENSVEGEPVTDSFSDVSNYGVMKI